VKAPVAPKIRFVTSQTHILALCIKSKPSHSTFRLLCRR